MSALTVPPKTFFEAGKEDDAAPGFEQTPAGVLFCNLG